MDYVLCEDLTLSEENVLLRGRTLQIDYEFSDNKIEQRLLYDGGFAIYSNGIEILDSNADLSKFDQFAKVIDDGFSPNSLQIDGLSGSKIYGSNDYGYEFLEVNLSNDDFEPLNRFASEDLAWETAFDEVGEDDVSAFVSDSNVHGVAILYRDKNWKSILMAMSGISTQSFQVLTEDGGHSNSANNIEINNRNTVSVKDGLKHFLWIDGIDNEGDLAYDRDDHSGSPVYGTPIEWDEDWGDAPPLNLNAQMRGFRNTSVDGAMVPQIWQNCQWEIIEIEGYEDIKIYDINDNGVLAAQVTKTDDGTKSVGLLLPVEVRDVNGLGNADDVRIMPWDTSQDIANNNIAWIDAHRGPDFSVTIGGVTVIPDLLINPRMPQLEFRVPGLTDGLTIEAKLFVEYERPYAGKQDEDTVRIPANGNFVQVNGETWEIYSEADWQTELNERGFFGGDARLTYQIKNGANIVVGPEEIDFAIGGENPTDDRCKQYTQSRPGAPWYAYAIEKHESQAYNPGFYNQFWERSGNSSPINGGINYEFTLGDPLKVLSPGETGVGGTGLAQVTGAGGNKNNPAAREIFWDWRRNVDAFLAILAGKIQIAETFMNDQTPRNGPGSIPNGQRPQTTFHTGQNVPVPSRDQDNVTFGDNQGERRPEDAVAIKAYNGASAHWCSWRGPAVHEWQWNYGQNNYVERVCEQIEEEVE
ncbi:MAG: hypothetical protein ACSHX7_12960 [Luteolibacter sp.]